MPRITWFVLIFNGVFLSFSVATGISGHDDPLFYFEERRGVTFFSALFLGCASLVSGVIAHLHYKLNGARRFLNFWGLSSFGFFYLCLDEYFMIHEGMDRAILASLGKDPLLVNFDALILAGLGLLGMFLFWIYRRELLKFRDFVVLFALATACFFVMIIFDHFASHTFPWMIFEDSFKLLGVTFFFGAYLSALNGYHERMILRSNTQGGS